MAEEYVDGSGRQRWTKKKEEKACDESEFPSTLCALCVITVGSELEKKNTLRALRMHQSKKSEAGEPVTEQRATCAITAWQPKNNTSKNRPPWVDDFNKRGLLGLPFFHLTGRHAKKERHQRKTQLHMQTWTETCRVKSKGAMLDQWHDALHYVSMNPKWPSLHLHDCSSMGEHNARSALQCINHTYLKLS